MIRHWQFSLRQLIAIVGILCVWLGYSLYHVRERERIAKVATAAGGGVVLQDNPGWNAQLPITWQLLGAKPARWLFLPAQGYTDSDWTHVRREFPEAEVLNGIPVD
jgi:hypothetical protein